MPITAVTGSASGIGAALCRQLREAGHQIIGIDRAGADVNADLSTPAGRAEAVRQVLEKSGGVLDHLVLCAGLGVTAPSSGLIVAVNYFGVSALLDGLAEALGKGNSPSAVVVGSVASVQPGADRLEMVEAMLAGDEEAAVAGANQLNEPSMAYAGSKYAASVLVRRKVHEWAKLGIRLNVVAPGVVETPLYKASTEDPKYGEATRNFVAPLGRGSQPDELAGVIRFLLSEQASFMHGTVVFADGGMDAMMRPNRF
ncbi:SDR family oxidoreductase [Pseudomonas jinjuensis]|uniref:NAD(P)-dependent dehydrogenase, short-chain alcohol dehydrogenase family n=1 Tax=Pseudomonas jinjuensis TaxID=198616 RepID=A0A1H0R5J6_9PSED|nr:SDR family oxidoreductase [Pseudomonas jinjuensis]SDP24336.1 NAD(P)-dependent dehydrogenase, short-chain alcohol dehydrogenase family [Pseudomonas jinjuensis]